MQTLFYKNNRKNITSSLNGGLVVLSAYTQLQRQNDAAFRFDQESNFLYLTGITKSDWRCIIDGSSGEEWLVMPKTSAIHEVFDGSLKAADASKISGIKKVISHDEALSLLRRLAKKHSVVHTIDNPSHADWFNFSLNPALSENKRLLERIFPSVIDCQKQLAKLRAIKQPEEIKAIQSAVNLTITGFEHVRSMIPDAAYEYELEAEFTYVFRRRKNARHAYDPIVAAGKNACTLHYVDNDTKLTSKDLVLMDIGARVDGYAADITRTYAKQTLSKRKQQVHRTVVAAHEAIIALIEPNLSVELYQQRVDEIMKQSLRSLGLLSSLDDDMTYRRYFPHAVSHGLGLDVHDSLGNPRALEECMVLTVEPGIYIPEEGIGVRIEDDILITKTGHKNLSAKLSTDW